MSRKRRITVVIEITLADDRDFRGELVEGIDGDLITEMLREAVDHVNAVNEEDGIEMQVVSWDD